MPDRLDDVLACNEVQRSVSASVVPAAASRVGLRSALARAPVAWRLLAAVAMGAALRFGFLSDQSLWTDEGATRHIVLAPSIGDVWPRVRATESTPPLSYWLMWLIAHAAGSRSDAILRFVPAVAGTLTIHSPACRWTCGPEADGG